MRAGPALPGAGAGGRTAAVDEGFPVCRPLAPPMSGLEVTAEDKRSSPDVLATLRRSREASAMMAVCCVTTVP